MKKLFTSLPVFIALADMAYGFALNISQGLNLRQNIPSDGTLAVTPDIAFNSLQIIANGGMIAIIGFGLLTLLQLNGTVLKHRILPIGIFRTLGLLAVLAFSVPSLWEWGSALIAAAAGQAVFNFGSPRYLVSAFCMPLIALLCLKRLYDWYRLHRTVQTDTTSAPAEPSDDGKTVKKTV